MDITDTWPAAHGYLTTLARRIADDLSRYVRVPPVFGALAPCADLT